METYIHTASMNGWMDKQTDRQTFLHFGIRNGNGTDRPVVAALIPVVYQIVSPPTFPPLFK